MRRSASSCPIGTGLLCMLVAAAAACNGDADRPRKSGPVGVLTGTVRLAGGAQLPSYARVDLAQPSVHAPAHPSLPPDCAAAAARATTPVTMDGQRGLSNIVIAASDFTHVHEHGTRTHHVAIEGCTLVPRTIVARAGDRLQVENHDAFGFEPLIGPGFGPKRLGRGEHITEMLTQGVESVACTPRAPCGRTDVVVLYHPVAGVSDARGTFRIENFPAREIVRLTAWHPLFEESETFVWVDAGQQSSVDLLLKPKPRFQ